MNKHIVIFALMLFSIGKIAAQEDSVHNLPDSGLVVTAEQIKNYSNRSFLEAMNGLFPLVFSQNPNGNGFSFVIDGYQLQNINSISLNDIAQIEYRVNEFNSLQYPFPQQKVFYITTKKSTSNYPNISFNTQYNHTAIKQTDFISNPYISFPNPNVDYKTIKDDYTIQKGGYSSNHLSVAFGKKVQVFAAIEMNTMKNPSLAQQKITSRYLNDYDTFANANNLKQNNIRSYVTIETQLNKKFKIGIQGNYFNGKLNSDSNNNYQSILISYQTVNIENKLKYYHFGGFIQGTIGNRINIEARYEQSKNKISAFDEETNVYAGESTIHKKYVSEKNDFSNKRFKLSAAFSFIKTKKFTAELKSNYTNIIANDVYESVTEKGNLILNNISKKTENIENDKRYNLLHPKLFFNYHDAVSLEASTIYLFAPKEWSYTFNTGNCIKVSTDLKKILFKGLPLKKLMFSTQAANYLATTSNEFWLNSFINTKNNAQNLAIADDFAPSNRYTFNEYPKSKLFNTQVTIGALNNRFSCNIGFSSINHLSSRIAYTTRQTSAGFVTTRNNLIVSNSQQSIFIAAKYAVVTNNKNLWEISGNIASSKYDLDTVKGYSDTASGSFPVLVRKDPIEYTTTIGLQNYIKIKRVSVYFNILMGLNKTLYAYDDKNRYKGMSNMNEFSINYVKVNYSLMLPKVKALEGLEVFLHAQNLHTSSEAQHMYQRPMMIGLGLNANF